MVEVFKSTSLRRMTTGGNYINVSADVVLASDYASLEAELKAAREETERWAAVANREDEARRVWQAESARLQKAAKLALQRLGELNRDDEAGVRMVLANAIDAALSQPPVGERGLSEWEGWDQSRGVWSASKHKDAVCEALFRAPWSVEDAHELLTFIDRTWTKRPASPGREG